MEKVLNMVYGSQNVNLESQKIELSGVRDVKSAVEQGDKASGLSLKKLQKSRQIIVDVISDLKNSNLKYNKGLKSFSEVEKQLKSIGVPMPPEISTLGNSIDEKISKNKALIGELLKAIGSF